VVTRRSFKAPRRRKSKYDLLSYKVNYYRLKVRVFLPIPERDNNYYCFTVILIKNDTLRCRSVPWTRFAGMAHSYDASDLDETETCTILNQSHYNRVHDQLSSPHKGLKASIRLAEPTARVPKKLRRQFMFSLSPSERQTLKAAQRWYQSVYQRRGLRKAG